MSIEQLRLKAERLDLEKIKSKLESRMACVAKVNLFGNDGDDEFGVIRESGWRSGIFKTWSVPVIPFFEDGLEGELGEVMKDNQGEDFWELTGERGVGTVSEWAERMKSEPLKLASCLEKWRMLSDLADRRLSRIFSEIDLPEDREARVAELILRMELAFGMAAPFYHLEAMIAETRPSWFNPVKQNGENGGGGALDIIGLVLPAAMGDKVISSKLNWNGLDWNLLARMGTGGVLTDEGKKLAFRIAREIGTGVEDVLFAANALEFIPVSVGGKKTDLPIERAQEIIHEQLAGLRKAKTVPAVARNMNALIRFLNWFPQNRSEENFDGVGWRYSAVCDTASQLVTELSKGGLFKQGFDEIFVEQLSGQVAEVDATSAKGRFMLELIREGRLGDKVSGLIKERRADFTLEMAARLLSLERDEAIFNIRTPAVRALVGGKAAGLREAEMILGSEATMPGLVVTTEFVMNWLRDNEKIDDLLRRINKSENVEEKLVLGEMLRVEIGALEMPLWMRERIKRETGEWHSWAVRSSSFDEDTLGQGTAAGIYESCLRVSPDKIEAAIRNVTASFFSDKAISYRHMNGLADDPLIAMVINPFLEGEGGAIFTKGNRNDWEVVAGKNAEEIVASSSSDFDSIKKTGSILKTNLRIGVLNEQEAKLLGAMALAAEEATGDAVDMEFIKSEMGLLIIQMRSLQNNTDADKKPQTEDLNLKDVLIYKSREWSLDMPSRLWLDPEIDIEQFQGELFRKLVQNKGMVKEIILARRIPRTSHFANICLGLGIKLTFLT